MCATPASWPRCVVIDMAGPVSDTGMKTVLPIFLTAFFVVTICSKSSFLYPLNDWEDANCYFTVGKSIMKGLHLYKDIIEQKGPIVYFVHAIASVISDRSFLGVYLIEIITAFLYLYFTYKIFLLYAHEKTAYALLIFSAIITYSSFSFQHGDSVEELCLPIIACGVYVTAKYFRDQDRTTLPVSVFFVHGIFAGCILWMKFTILGFYIGWMSAILTYYVYKKFYKNIVHGIFTFLFGIIVVTIPLLAYFILNKSLGIMFNAYFYDNIFRYANISNILAPLYNPLLFFARCSWYNDFMPCILSLACLYSLFISKDMLSHFEKFNYASLLFFTLYGQVSGGKFYQSYYFLVIIPLLLYAASSCVGQLQKKSGRFFHYSAKTYLVLFSAIIFSAAHSVFEINLSYMMHNMAFRTLQKIFGLGAGLGLLAMALSAESRLKNSISTWKTATGTVFVSVVFSFLLSQNTWLLCMDKGRLPQYQFAGIINQVSKATLLNYDFLDGGFYTASGIVPTTKYFCRLNLNAPEMVEEQRRIVAEGLCDFVVCRAKGGEPPHFAMYGLLATSQFEYENCKYTYFLFGRRDICRLLQTRSHRRKTQISPPGACPEGRIF